MDKRKLLHLIPAATIVVLFHNLESLGSLHGPALTAAGLLLASLWLWISEALPMYLSILMMIVVAVVTKLITPQDVLLRMDSGTALFVLASSAITATVSLSTIPQRVTRWMVNQSRGNPTRFVVWFGLMVTLCSSFMSSLATCAMFAGLATSMLGPKRSNLKRCLLMVVPACAGIGGFITPAGTPANLLLLSILESSGTPITFAQWCMIGAPVGILTALAFLCSVLLHFRPTLDDLVAAPDDSAVDSRRDKMTIIIVALILSGWFLSSWVRELKLWYVACAGMLIMLIPQLGLLKVRILTRHINWDLVITMGTVGVLMGAISDSGLAAWLREQILAPFTQLPMWLLLPALSLAICFLRSFIPTTSGAVTLLAPVLISLAVGTSQPACVLLMILGFWTASALLVVWTEPIYLLTWANRDYSAGDLLRAGILPSLFMAVVGVWLIRTLTLLLLT